ncbi:MAG: zinc-ribbon domain containing protein [Pseudomonadota bacterium]
MSAFGKDDPRDMPEHFFFGARHLDYDSAERADSDRQNCSVCPRYWYVPATFVCARCEQEFVFGVAEQRAWYEQYYFWVDAFPKHCQSCRRALRTRKALRQHYDHLVADALASTEVDIKRRAIEIIDALYELHDDLPDGINDKRRRLARALARSHASIE